ncbi:MAG: 2-amino-3,7-dideoxy-D-threo-hept-6-ulosonate synthase [Firmicutes bacterium]|nr:2-amino-3,7-dideoxy-D-threo-hept-6-ulosonate synthase [Bacillota bacterium]
MTGVNVRLRRIFKDAKAVICPLDYGGFMGPVKGIDDPSWIIDKVVRGGADAILVNPGFARSEWKEYAGRTGLIVRVTGGASKFSPRGDFHTLVCTVEEACALGADAVCVMILVGSECEQEMFGIMGCVISDSHALGIPVLAEVIPSDPAHSFDPEWISVCARVGYELGADVIKTYFTGESFRDIVRACRVPIVIAGGPKVDDSNTMVARAMDCGAAGIAFGRNVFQAEDPEQKVRELCTIVHEGVRRG